MTVGSILLALALGGINPQVGDGAGGLLFAAFKGAGIAPPAPGLPKKVACYNQKDGKHDHKQEEGESVLALSRTSHRGQRQLRI